MGGGLVLGGVGTRRGRAGPGLVLPAVAQVIHGRFESWIAPDDAAADQVAAELGGAVREALASTGGTSDALSAWLQVRATTFTNFHERSTHDPVRVDAHRLYIEGLERSRDSLRASRMAEALVRCRASASAGGSLTFEVLESWQAIVLGESQVTFRHTDAFAKGGRERYPFTPDLPARFEQALHEADGNDPLSVRAARAYLDVCLFHPFADGNARAARLAMEFVLWRAGWSLHVVEPLFVVARAARDGRGAWSLAWLVDELSGPRAK